MVSFWEVLDRASNTGPMLEPREFDMLVFKTANELVKEFDIKYDPQTPVPSDDSLADDLFESGLRLYLKTGTYCIQTHRQIKFSEGEIKEAMRKVPSKILIGEGAETMWLKQRKVEDVSPPLNLGGVIEGNPQEGTMFVKLYQSIAQEKEAIDGIYFGPPFTVEGRTWRPGTPLEAHAGICAANWAREALRRVGRPGLHLLSACPSAIGDIASCDPQFGVRPSDSIVLPTTSELKTDYDSLAKVAFSLNYGCHRHPYWLPMIGGYAGGPPGAAIVGVAGAFHAILVYQLMTSGYATVAAGSIKIQGATQRDAIWLRSLVTQALVRNTSVIVGTGCTTCAGPGTEMMFLELASTTIGSVTCGCHIMDGARKEVLVKPNQASGLEPRFQGEVAKGVRGLKRVDANQIVKILLQRYEDKLTAAPEGKSFDELYDLITLTPRLDYLQVYNKVKDELGEMGLRFLS